MMKNFLNFDSVCNSVVVRFGSSRFVVVFVAVADAADVGLVEVVAVVVAGDFVAGRRCSFALLALIGMVIVLVLLLPVELVVVTLSWLKLLLLLLLLQVLVLMQGRLGLPVVFVVGSDRIE